MGFQDRRKDDPLHPNDWGDPDSWRYDADETGAGATYAGERKLPLSKVAIRTGSRMSPQSK